MAILAAAAAPWLAAGRRESGGWRARLRQYQAARNAVVAPADGWLGLDDEDEWAAMLFSRWPVLSDDVVRGPPEVPAGRRDPA